MKRWRRKNYLINKEFQFRYIGRILFGMLVMAAIVSFTVYYTTWARIMDEFYNIPRIASEFAPLFASVNQTLLFLFASFLVVAGLLSVFMSHAIAGPIYRFEQTLRAIAQGDLTLRIGLRKTDEFKHLAESVNDMVSELNRNLRSDAALLGEVVRASERLHRTGEGGQLPAPISEDLGALHENLRKLERNLGRFKL